MTRAGTRGAHVLVALTAVVLAACSSSAGSADDEPGVRSAERALAAAREGTVAFELGASTDGTQAVGFRITGQFAMDVERRYPLLDITYERFPSPVPATRVISTGDEVYAGPETDLRQVPPARASALERRAGRTGFVQFAFSEWLEGRREEQAGRSTVVTGGVNVARFLTDLARGTAQLGTATDLPEPDAQTTARLQRLVEASEMRVTFDTETGLFQSLRVDIVFRADASEELRAALGAYAGVRLEVNLTYSPLEGPFEPTVPGQS